MQGQTANYCSLVWNFSSSQSLKKIENLQKRASHFLLNNDGSTYAGLLETSDCPNKALNKLNSGYTNDIFKLRNVDRLTREKCKLNLENPKPNHATIETEA